MNCNFLILCCSPVSTSYSNRSQQQPKTLSRIISFQNLRKKYYIPGELKTREEVEGKKWKKENISFSLLIQRLYNVQSSLSHKIHITANTYRDRPDSRTVIQLIEVEIFKTSVLKVKTEVLLAKTRHHGVVLARISEKKAVSRYHLSLRLLAYSIEQVSLHVDETQIDFHSHSPFRPELIFWLGGQPIVLCRLIQGIHFAL